mmetsp:Transcript_6640/g.15983  ORF Transcript_6640/g.15983 Transcript_6640/m.15983 type:complete len:193 (-) Transcript_6640:751-1329(-)
MLSKVVLRRILQNQTDTGGHLKFSQLVRMPILKTKSTIRKFGASEGSSNRTQPRLCEGREGLNYLGCGASVLYHPQAIAAEDCDQLFKHLKANVRWARRAVRVMGREVMQPRLVAYMADSASQAYTYSGATLAPDPWDPFVLKIKEEVEKHTGGFKWALLTLPHPTMPLSPSEAINFFTPSLFSIPPASLHA